MIRGAVNAGALVLVALLVVPIGWTAVGSFLPDARLFDPSDSVSGGRTIRHYTALFAERGFARPIWNSVLVSGLTTALAVPVAALCAYALARLRLRRKSLLLALVLAVSMFPQISVVAPLYLLLRELRLIDTYPGLVLPYVTFATPLAIWLLTGFFRQLPPELEDAALIDGAGRLRILRDIVAPLAAPALASTAILTFLYAWNEFLFALTFTTDPARHTVPVAIALFRGRYQVPWGQVLAAAVIATIPVALVVIAFQRRIVAGLTAGALKG